jgi:DNA-binding HxlR family transcriptional regulator
MLPELRRKGPGEGEAHAMQDEPWCPVAATVEVIGGKWKPTILFHLKDGPRRFNELRRLVPGITQRMLTLQLRALEADGIVRRIVHEEVPPRVEYAFSERGLTLGPLLDAMERWGEAYGTRERRAGREE